MDISDIMPKRRPWGRIILISCASLALLLIVVGIVAKDARPGERLYTYRTQVSERVLGATKLSSYARATYATHLLETRLQETKVLSTDAATSTPQTLEAVARRMDAHTRTATKAYIDAGRTPEDTLASLTHVAGIATAAQEYVALYPELRPMHEIVRTAQNTASDALQSEITSYVSNTSPENVHAYLEARVQAITASLTTLAQGSDAQRRVTARVNDLHESMLENNLNAALFAALRAEQAKLIDTLLWTGERGEEPLTVPTDIPTEGQ